MRRGTPPFSVVSRSAIWAVSVWRYDDIMWVKPMQVYFLVCQKRKDSIFSEGTSLGGRGSTLSYSFYGGSRYLL